MAQADGMKLDWGGDLAANSQKQQRQMVAIAGRWAIKARKKRRRISKWLMMGHEKVHGRARPDGADNNRRETRGRGEARGQQ